MRITNVDTICLSRPHELERQWYTARYRTVKADCAIVVIETDEGIAGIGEACAYGVPSLLSEWVAWLRPGLLGKDPSDTNIVPHPNGRSRPHDTAVAGIDCALWDLRGKIKGKKVAELLASGSTDQVPIYASSGCRYDWRDRPEQLIEEVQGYADEGYPACKVRMGTEWAWDGVTTDRFLGLMRELAEAVGNRIQLMVDGNQRLSVDEGIEVAKGLEKLGFTWFEEPIPQSDIDGYARINAAVDMPITGGEQFTTLEQFRSHLERRAYDIVQPDAGLAGISECMRIAEMAARYGVEFCPHSWHNGLMAMANGHMLATLASRRFLEVCMIQGPLQWEILAEKPTIENGMLSFPGRPGLGVDLATDLEERFPYIEGHYAVVIER